MRNLLLLILFSTSVMAHESTFKTKADSLAFGKYTEQRHYQWPIKLLSIGHAMQSYQNYGDSPYWHDGLDVRANKNEDVFAAVGGTVVNIENYVKGNPLYWEVAIRDDEGFVWKYHHVEEASIPPEIKNSLKNQTKIPDGTRIGRIVTWPISSYGEVYHHLHLLVVGADKKYVNPFLLLDPLLDTQAPVINRIGLSQNHAPLTGNRVNGSFSLFVEASDLILHQKFIVPPHKITYQIDGGEEVLFWEFINLPSGASDEIFISDFYLKGTCGNYSCRKILINLGFTPSNPRGLLTLPAGAHDAVVTVEDIVGNKARLSYQWVVE